jgi:hypothetical protein
MAVILWGAARCALTDKLLEETDDIVCFPPFATDFDDPLYLYHDSCVLREAFDKCEHREAILARFHEFMRQCYEARPSSHLFLDEDDYMVEWGGMSTIRLIFTNHAFILAVYRSNWRAFRKTFSKASRTGISTCRIGNRTVSVQVSEDEIQISQLSRSTDGTTLQDRIRVSQREWERLLEILKEVDKELLPQMDKASKARR